MDEKSTKNENTKEVAQADAADCEPILIVNCDTHNPCGVVHLYLSPCGHSCVHVVSLSWERLHERTDVLQLTIPSCGRPKCPNPELMAINVKWYYLGAVQNVISLLGVPGDPPPSFPYVIL